ncbi:MAG: hypothetical protein VCF08_14925 [Alphaproteobacteria bacterium]
MRVMTTIPQHDLRQVPDVVRTIEAKGYDGVTTLENRHDPFMPLGVAANSMRAVRVAVRVRMVGL